MRHYPVEKKFEQILTLAGLPVKEVLQRANLSLELFNSENPVLTTEEYFNFMKAIESFSVSDELVLQLSTADSIETFSPPAFAAYCSKNALHCLLRMAEYEALFCGIDFNIEETDDTISLEIKAMDSELVVPRLLILIKMIFIVHMIRKASNTMVIPNSLMTQYSMEVPELQSFFGIPIALGKKNQIVFKKEDMLLPFLSENESMWTYFEPELTRRKQELDLDESFSGQVRNCLVELLAGGESSILAVAKKLSISTRTLQRKLQQEGTNFQQQLNHTRELLAKNYIKDQQLNVEEIAFLLGYQDVSSFQRAFAIWTGKSVSEYRKGMKEA